MKKGPLGAPFPLAGARIISARRTRIHFHGKMRKEVESSSYDRSWKCASKKSGIFDGI